MGTSAAYTCFRLRRLGCQNLPRLQKFAHLAALSPQQASPFCRTPASSRSFWTLSFSGAGHLMPYHIGVAKTLLSPSSSSQDSTNQTKESFNKNAVQELPMRSVSGSSSGAIAATVMTLLPHRLEEYADRFLQDRGHAVRNLRQMLEEEEETIVQQQHTTSDVERLPKSSSGLELSICTTRCSDGGIEIFSFSDHLENRNESERDGHNNNNKSEYHERLLKAIEASCLIPRSFHPFDMVALNYKDLLQKRSESTYPDEEGIEIDGKGYVDGGIAAPFPPTPMDGDEGCTGRIVVSPIAGEYFYKTTDDNVQHSQCLPLLKAVCPTTDASWKAPWIDSVAMFGSGKQQNDDAPLVGVRASPSLQNLRNLTTAMGVVPASPHDEINCTSGILRDWYERGQADAHEMLNEL